MKVFKYVLDDHQGGDQLSFKVPMPGAFPTRQPKVLHFGIQHDKFCVWAEVDPAGDEIYDWYFQIVPTGGDAPGMPFIGTAFTDAAGTFVFHLYGKSRVRG